ncbi:MAG: 4-(cytidine 5'-diphospho)-2-C-methyl-D-erythritol kinase [Sedimentisphaerales bacterium]|jgi:4-diphosphocytidyl-2-C-methyl-D-erythritol kinase
MAISKQFEKRGDGLLVRAPAKINLSLLVKGKRPDGYHELETIMAKIDWYDEILIENNLEFRIKNSETRKDGNKEKGRADIELICKGPYEVPAGEDNLVYKAAKLILEKAIPAYCMRGQARKKQKGKINKELEKREKPLRITLTKNMPAGTGLGSGSSNAAGTLMGINRFLKLGFSKKKLMELAAKLGSDVAFFLGGPLAMCTGRGEKVKKIDKCEFGVLLIVPDVNVSTQRVYANYRHDSAKYGRLHKEISGYIKKKRIDLVCELCANMLQESCFELNTKLRELKKRIERAGIRPLCLSGSGSSMYCVINKGNEERVKAYRNNSAASKLARDFSFRSIIVNNNSW